ncbi:AAA family ATPase [Candidatus Parabeggiatoa sp. HSG14]|uniref:AAA family ATPase n=1 Tax=Candidatus Parabeggiatoa sp. HSG14 TaxID=3055593 RepID=UPI0025A80E40|nr:AAA family ATPase [Thiotrichales bacterium HSG14]
MFLKRIQIEKFRILENVNFEFKQRFTPTIFPLGSLNGGGKSTLLQLVFTLLHCSFNKERHQYLVNLLANFPLDDETTSLAKFAINHNDEDFCLEFIVSTNNFEGQDFNVFLDVEEIEEKVEENKRLKFIHSHLLELESEINSLQRITPLFRNKIREFRGYHDLYMMTRDKNTKADYKSAVHDLLSSYEENINSNSDLNSLLTKEKHKKSQLLELLKQKGMLYITHLDNERVLLCKTTVDINILTEMSDKIYLAAPSTQMFLFLSDEEKQTIFAKDSDHIKRISDVKDDLKNFFTYDFASAELIIKAFEKARDKDFENALEFENYDGKNLKKLKSELNSFLYEKTITVDKKLSKVIFKMGNTKLLPEDLSHGELKKLSIYIWLKYHEIDDALVLMDEIEIALHPDWQYEIVHELQDWSKNNQFILATHSYGLCEALTPSHVIELEPKLIKESI